MEVEPQEFLMGASLRNALYFQRQGPQLANLPQKQSRIPTGPCLKLIVRTYLSLQQMLGTSMKLEKQLQEMLVLNSKAVSFFAGYPIFISINSVDVCRPVAVFIEPVLEKVPVPELYKLADARMASSTPYPPAISTLPSNNRLAVG